jgi:hypothetical protein
MVKVSPEATDLLEASGPYQSRVPPVAAVYSSMCDTVAVGMLVNTRSAEFEHEPEDGVENEAACRAYEPPETAVPGVASSGAEVQRAT